MSATMPAAVHLGQNYPENLPSTRNTEEIKTIFRCVKEADFVRVKKEFRGYLRFKGTRIHGKTTLLSDRAVGLFTAKIEFF